MIILDTNVVSELMRPAPSTAVLAWLRRQSAGELRTTCVTVAEIRYGIARLPAGRRRAALAQTADEVFAAFPHQILPFNVAAANAYADIVAARERLGSPVDALDAQIAAICRTHAADLATRNGKDFTGMTIGLINPWEPAHP